MPESGRTVVLSTPDHIRPLCREGLEPCLCLFMSVPLLSVSYVTLLLYLLKKKCFFLNTEEGQNPDLLKNKVNIVLNFSRIPYTRALHIGSMYEQCSMLASSLNTALVIRQCRACQNTLISWRKHPPFDSSTPTRGPCVCARVGMHACVCVTENINSPLPLRPTR